MTPFQWFQVASFIVACIAAAAVWIWGRDRTHTVATAVSAAVDEQQIAFVHRRIDDDRSHVHQRFDQASALISKLSSYVQELPTRHEYDELSKAVSSLATEYARMRERIALLEGRA